MVSNGIISVQNICRNLNGSVQSLIEGKAKVVGSGRLKISFKSVPFGASDYWVLGSMSGTERASSHRLMVNQVGYNTAIRRILPIEWLLHVRF